MYNSMSLQVQQLRKIYSALKEMLSLDFVPYLPHEVTEKIFTYLDVSSLCSAARCSHSWRELTDNDKLWYSNQRELCIACTPAG